MTADAISVLLIVHCKSLYLHHSYMVLYVVLKMFKTCFHIIFRSLLKNLPWVWNIISSVGKAINILLILLSTLRLVDECSSSQGFCILTVLFSFELLKTSLRQSQYTFTFDYDAVNSFEQWRTRTSVVIMYLCYKQKKNMKTVNV